MACAVLVVVTLPTLGRAGGWGFTTVSGSRRFPGGLPEGCELPGIPLPGARNRRSHSSPATGRTSGTKP